MEREVMWEPPEQLPKLLVSGTPTFPESEKMKFKFRNG